MDQWVAVPSPPVPLSLVTIPKPPSTVGGPVGGATGGATGGAIGGGLIGVTGMVIGVVTKGGLTVVGVVFELVSTLTPNIADASVATGVTIGSTVIADDVPNDETADPADPVNESGSLAKVADARRPLPSG
jgi:hypothetical protein